MNDRYTNTKHNNLTRRELAESLSNRLGYSQSNCALIVDSFLDKMKQTLLDGETIKLVHFGTFTVRDKAPRKGRNPRTGETIQIKASNVPGFKAGKALKEAVN